MPSCACSLLDVLQFHGSQNSASPLNPLVTLPYAVHMMKRLHLLLLLALSASLSACVNGRVYVRAYSGEEVPVSRQALLKPASSIKILAVDGDTSKAISASQSFGNTDYEVGLLPGIHTYVVSYNSGTASSKSSISGSFAAEAGRRYLLRANVARWPLSWHPEVIDVTERPECWTVLAETVVGKCK